MGHVVRDWRSRVASCLAVAVAIGTVGCSKSQGSGEAEGGMNKAQSQPNSAQELQGKWDSVCSRAQGPGYTESASLTVSNLDVTRIVRVSSSGDCSTTAFEVRMEGSFTKGAAVASGATEIDISLQSIHVKPLSDVGVSILKLAKWCGTTDWAVGVEREVTSATGSDPSRCFSKTPTNLYNIYGVEGDKLYFGASQVDMTKPSNRPVELDRDYFYTKAQ